MNALSVANFVAVAVAACLVLLLVPNPLNMPNLVAGIFSMLAGVNMIYIGFKTRRTWKLEQSLSSEYIEPKIRYGTPSKTCRIICAQDQKEE